MKDKRQRIAMTWPYDPTIYAYLVNAAAAASIQSQQYPYPAVNTHSSGAIPPPFAAYYASMGLQCAAAAYNTPSLPALDFLSRSAAAMLDSSHPVTSLVPPPGLQSSPSLPMVSASRGLTAAPRDLPNLEAHSPISGHMIGGRRCTCTACCGPLLYGHVTSAKSSVYSPGGAGKTLFQPFKADVERA
jgi:hypothetical protein